MAIGLSVAGNGRWSGPAGNIGGYSITEDASPLDASDSFGSTGSFSFKVLEDPGPEGTILLMDDVVTLSDGIRGTTVGTVDSVPVTNGVATISGSGRLNLLVADRTALPMTGTIPAVFTYYLGLAGVTTGIVIDAAVPTTVISVPGWFGSVWTLIKEFATAYQLEVTLVSNDIVLRPIRARIADMNPKHISSEGYSVQLGNVSQFIEVYYGNNRQVTNTLVYPKGGWNDQVQVLQIDAGQTQVFPIELTGVSLLSVQQPIQVDNVPSDYVGPTSVYTVRGNDGTPVAFAEWTGQGGSVTVAISDDTNTLNVTVVGSRETANAPYAIALADDTGTSFSTLRIMGSAVFFDEDQKITLATGAGADKTSKIVGVSIHNPFISTISDAYRVGIPTAHAWSGTQQSIKITTSVINRPNDDGSLAYPTFDDFFAEFGALTYDEFFAAWGAHTYDDFSAYEFSKVAKEFQNQVFGNTAGARAAYRQAIYRIRTATITESSIQFSADIDTTFDDFYAVWGGHTYDEFADWWSGKTYSDLSMIPLWGPSPPAPTTPSYGLVPSSGLAPETGLIPGG